MSANERVAMVTGGGRGIGAAIAMRLAVSGHAVAVCDIDETLAETTSAGLAADGGRAIAVRVDVADGRSVRAAVEHITAQLGPIDVLVNSAGIDAVELFVDSTEETWDRIIAVNLKGTIQCCHAVIDSMIERGTGRIVNIGSDAGRVGSTGEAVYSATKGGVIAFTKTLAREVARHQITVNCVCPGPTDTAMLAQAEDFNPKLFEGLTKAIPLRRIGRPDDIAAMVAFLATADASYMTGQTISVSGGLTMV